MVNIWLLVNKQWLLKLNNPKQFACISKHNLMNQNMIRQMGYLK